MMPAFPKPTLFCTRENSDPSPVLVDQFLIVYNLHTILNREKFRMKTNQSKNGTVPD